MTFAELMTAHDELRDHIAVTTTINYPIEPAQSLYAVVVAQSLLFAFNTYKAAGIILRESYYEQASVLVRILWETTLNLAWISKDPTNRAKLFCQFTVVEKRKFLSFKIDAAVRLRDATVLTQAKQNLLLFDKEYSHVLIDYQFDDKKGRTKLRGRASGPTIAQEAEELGGHWAKEYREVYPLLSMYTHATPGAILFPNSPDRMFDSAKREEEEMQRTQLTVLWSMALIERAYRFLVPMGAESNNEYFDSMNARCRFRESLCER